MATLIGNNKPSMMAFPSALNRMGTFPIDISSVWYSYDEAVAYATQTNFTPKYEGQTGLPYVGQILTVVETAEDGTTSVTAYSIQNEAGELAQVGTVTLGDDATIVRDEKTGALSLYGIDKLTWKETVKDAEGNATEKDVTTYQPKLVKKDGKVVLTWEIPSAITAEGLSTRIQTAEGNIGQLGKDIGAVKKDLADNYYNKKDIDTKITSVFKFQGVKTYKDELPTTGQVWGDVWLVIYDGNTPAEGETNTLPVANIEYVWTTENKWEPLGDDIIDLTNYYTKGEVDDIVKPLGKVESVAAGTEAWTLAVTDKGKATETITIITGNASNTAYGVVKGDGTNVSIVDGVITVNKAEHAAEATHATKADKATNADEAGKVTNALKIKINNDTTYSFDGSTADVTVPLDNYYTKAEADNNFMHKSEFDTEVEKIVQPINEELDKIKGEGYGAFVDPEDETKGKIEPSLMSLYEHNKGQDNRLDTAENTIKQNTDRIKAIEDGYVDSKELEDSLKPIREDLANKGKVDDVVAAETAWDITVQYADGTTDKTVTIKTTTASKEQAGLVSVGNNIDVEAGKISVATAQTDKLGLVKGGQSNNSNVSITDGVIVVEKAKEAAKVTSSLTVREADKKDRTYDGSAADTIDLTPYAKTLDVNSSIGKINTALADRYTKAETNTYVAQQIAAIDHLKREVAESLPGTPDKNTIYLVPKTTGETDNIYLEYMYIDNKWEIIGDTKVDLTDYATKNYVGEEIGKIEHKWENIAGKPNLSYVEAKEATFSSTTTLTAEEGKIRNIEVYDADGERVILDIKRTSDLSYTLTAVGSTETLTVTYEVIHTVA